MTRPQALSVLRRVAWYGSVLLTVLLGFVVGHGAIWFQLFGDTADRGDYETSAGGYAAAAVVLLLSAAAAERFRGGRAVRWIAVSFAGLYSLLAVNAAVAAASLPVEPYSSGSLLDGVGGVLWAPWTWWLVAAGFVGLFRCWSNLRRDASGRAGF